MRIEKEIPGEVWRESLDHLLTQLGRYGYHGFSAATVMMLVRNDRIIHDNAGHIANVLHHCLVEQEKVPQE